MIRTEGQDLVRLEGWIRKARFISFKFVYFLDKLKNKTQEKKIVKMDINSTTLID